MIKPITLALIVIIFLSIRLVYAADTASQNQDLVNLLHPFTSIQSIRIPFKEKRFSTFLKLAREYEGTIEYNQPDQFIKTITHPDWNQFIIENEQLHILSRDSTSGSNKEQTVSLDDFPQFKQFSTLFSGLLQGNAAIISRYYTYKIIPTDHSIGTHKNTRLVLQSRVVDVFIATSEHDDQHSGSSQHIEILFSGENNSHIKQISITGVGGERSVLDFSDPTFLQ